jgi:hypothetical protein
VYFTISLEGQVYLTDKLKNATVYVCVCPGNSRLRSSNVLNLLLSLFLISEFIIVSLYISAIATDIYWMLVGTNTSYSEVLSGRLRPAPTCPTHKTPAYRGIFQFPLVWWA